ncbi:MAG: hypothetical protein FP812_07335 [Desulfobacula sp.]|nr:hypothetical protein [Desulfobacula sp.]
MKKGNNFNVNFKDMLSDINGINEVLKYIGPDQFQVEEILSNYEKNGNRYGVIFMAKDNKTKKQQKIIIDGIYGEPNSRQIKDLTYGFGVDCDKRIILYTLDNLDSKVREYEYDGEMAEGFAIINNDCGIETYIFKMLRYIVGNGPFPLQLNAEVIPDGEKKTLHKILPSLQEFEQAEFGIFYNYSSDWRNPHHIEHPENWFDNYWHLIFQDISFRYPIWTEDGLFLQGVSKSEIGDLGLKWFMDSKIGLLKKFFDNREIHINTLPSGRNIMEIKLWDKPISYFAKTSIKNKERIAEAIRGYDSVTFEFLDNLFERQIPDKEVLKDLGYFPENAFMDLDTKISA